jgi:hypothetical protein
VKHLKNYAVITAAMFDRSTLSLLRRLVSARSSVSHFFESKTRGKFLKDERGDVPGWVLVVLMTTGLVTAIWTIAAPRLSAILRNSLDSMNGIR